MAVDTSIDVSDDDIEQSVAILMRRLPAPVRAFVQSKERTDIALALSQKYQLHVDQAGVFERAFLYMLLGASDPQGFVNDLREAGISDSVVTGLANDLNEQVFKKLRKQEQEMGSSPAGSAPPPAQPAPEPTPATVVPPPVEAAPAPEPAPPPPPAPEPPTPQPMRTMGADMAQMQAQYQPQYMQQPPIYPQMQPVQYVPFGYTPMPMPQQGGYWVPVVAPQQMPPPQYPQPQWQMPQPQAAPLPPQAPPPPAPVREPAHATPPPPPPPAPAPEPAAAAAPVRTPPPPPPVMSAPPPNLPRYEQSVQDATPLRKEYSVDPYREPI